MSGATCPKCGRQKEVKSSGSLTQWIVACTCDTKFDTGESPNQPLMCATCGKRIDAGRAGSFTQWIFRQDICSCSNPKVVPFDTRSVTPLPLPLEEIDDGSCEEEISIDERDFPIERYKPVQILGTGVSGRVYLCRDRLLKKRVAVKILTQVSQLQLVAFQREAKACSKLAHPRVVKILDFGVSGARSPYMVMECASGTSLELIRKKRGSLDWRAAFAIAVELCDALEYAHENGVFHRDIKPSNILVQEPDSPNPGVTLIDFGIAQVDSTGIEGHLSATTTTTIVGTPAYMSPDSISGLTYGRTSEIYSVGCVLYECIAGRPPFISDTALDTLRMHANREAPPLKQFNKNADIPQEIQDIVSKCLRKKPSHRYQSATELKIAMKRELRKVEVSEVGGDNRSSETAVPSQAPKAVPNTKTTTLAILSILGLIGILVLVVVSYSKFSPHPKSDSNDSRSLAKKTEIIEESVRPGGPVPMEDLFQVEPSKEVIAKGDIYDSDLRLIADSGVRRLTLNSQINITDGACKYFMMMPLEALVINKSSITDRGLKQLSRIETLKEFGFGRCGITDEGVKSLESLVAAAFWGCNVGDESLRHLGSMPNLQILNFSDTKITDQGLSYLAGAPNLLVLHLSHCDISDQGMKSIGNCPQLNNLNVSSTGIGLKGIVALRSLPLQDLDLANCRRFDDRCLRFVCSKFPRLVVLNIDETSVTRNGFPYLSKLRNLRNLSVPRTDFRDEDLDAILSLPKLHTLDLSSTAITDASLERLAQMPKLKTLTLNECKLISDSAMKKYQSRFKIRSSKLLKFWDDGDVFLEPLK